MARAADNCVLRSLGLFRDCQVFLDALRRNGPNVTHQAVQELAVIAMYAAKRPHSSVPQRPM